MDTIYNIIIILIILIVIVLLVNYSNFCIATQVEQFTALSGFNPLTSYDDYGTFNFILHTDDMPYYDKGFATLFCGKPDYVPGEPLQPHWDVDFHWDRDSFIDYEGYKVRRELIPSNYYKGELSGTLAPSQAQARSARGIPMNGDNLADADFDSGEEYIAIRKDRPKASAQPPVQFNYYFGREERAEYEPLF
jgi:hypothetical protein